MLEEACRSFGALVASSSERQRSFDRGTRPLRRWQRRTLHWQVGRGPDADWAVREGDWKLIGNARHTSQSASPPQRFPLFLANLKDDPGETTNLADQHPDLVDRLRRLHELHLD